MIETYTINQGANWVAANKIAKQICNELERRGFTTSEPDKAVGLQEEFESIILRELRESNCAWLILDPTAEDNVDWRKLHEPMTNPKSNELGDHIINDTKLGDCCGGDCGCHS
jgi:hypothetical protein